MLFAKPLWNSIILVVVLYAASAFAQQDTTVVQTDTTIRAAVDSIISETPVEEAETESDNTTHFSFSPNVGFTYGKISNDGEESENLQWQGQLQSRFSYEGEPQQFNASLFAQYGAQVSADAAPVKTMDNLTVTAVPSMTLVKDLGIRIFFEVTGETEMGKGMVDTVETTFLDPLFLYETLFLGHKTHSYSDDGTEETEFVFGVGYAYQQTITNKFVLAQNRQFVIDDDNPLSAVQEQFTVEKGYSGIIELNRIQKFSNDFSSRLGIKTVILTKDGFTDDIENCRVGTLLVAGLQYSIFSIDYTMHLLYDRNISPRRSLDQSMVFGLRFDL
jgi:hypothetical protein